MASKATFAGRVSDDGKLELWNQSGYVAYLRHLAGEKVVVTVSRDKATRSSEQNRFYWSGVVGLMAEELGYSKDDMHAILAYKFLRMEAETPAGTLPFVRSTASLKTDEFERYIEDIRIWAASDLGIVIPTPNEVL